MDHYDEGNHIYRKKNNTVNINNVDIVDKPKNPENEICRTGQNNKNDENKLTENEVKFWIESAKKEYFFTKERDIKYELENV